MCSCRTAPKASNCNASLYVLRAILLFHIDTDITTVKRREQKDRHNEVWAHPHNESFYLPPVCQATSEIPWEPIVSPEDPFKELIPDGDDLIQPSEPALQITFSKKPKNPKLGYLLGSDPELCDIYLGSPCDCIK